MAHNIADLFEHAVDAVPERPVLKSAGRTMTYAELEAESNRLAHFLAGRGIAAGEHVGLYAKNSIEHVVALLAIMKIRAVAVNVNYRFTAPELDYLVGDSDMVALVHDRAYAPLVAATAPQHDTLATVVVLPDGDAPEDDSDISAYGGVRWDDALEGQSAERDFGERSADDIHLVYTGGTTGSPKGVMWRHEDFWRVLCGGIDFVTGRRLEEFDQSRQALEGSPMATYPLSPLIHAGAQAGLLLHMLAGHLSVLSRGFDPDVAWQVIQDEKVQVIFLTGDAIARPMIETYEGGEYDGSSLVAVASSSAIFSPSVKARWMAAFPNTYFTDSIGSSEAGFQGTGARAGAEGVDVEHPEGPVFTPGPDTIVLDDYDAIVSMDSVGAIGRLARGGSVPLGYYKDEEKSARAFVEIDQQRYSVPGDIVRVEEGGRLTMLGRGSGCINTGGEKVFPEEVEGALKSHPMVFDALVVGIPDERYGQRVSAVVAVRPGTTPSLEDLRAFLRERLAGYKLPRSVAYVDEIPRSPSGKANYPRAKQIVLEQLSNAPV